MAAIIPIKNSQPVANKPTIPRMAAKKEATDTPSVLVALGCVFFKTPILVMNAEEEGMETCVEYDLEPAIYDFNQLDELLKVLIAQEKTAFPIHIKLDTLENYWK